MEMLSVPKSITEGHMVTCHTGWDFLWEFCYFV